MITNLPPEQEAIRDKCLHPSGTFVEFAKKEIEQSIPERFEKIVSRYSDRIAVKTPHHQSTYTDLNHRANQIAHALLARCTRKEETIGLLLRSDLSSIAAMLGVLKAGKIYVPLDPLLPLARIAFMLQDSEAALVITDTTHQSRALELTGRTVPVINLEELDPSLSTENPGASISPDALTWILYTSGSTGQPKGVVQTHRNVLHFVRNHTNGFSICPEDRLTHLFSASTVAAARDIFNALLNGASLHPFNMKEKGPKRMSEWLNQNQLTVYYSVSTVFRSFVETLTGEERFPHLRLIKLGGESVSRRDVESYQQYFCPPCLFVNRLGATETGTIRWFFIDRETRIDGHIVPVGYSVEDNEILLLDDTAKEVQAGEIGEIAVKSRYLTPGYWRKPDLTRSAFLPTEGHERIYLTGDVGRLLKDGLLLCLGRKDSQVKIRGHRVELAEIEMALLNLGSIKAAVVVTRENQTGEIYPAAYITSNENPPPTVRKLRQALAETLPEHMIPSVFMVLDAFPLAPSGKLDRRALPDPEQSRSELDTPFVLHRTPVEAKLASIWAEVLSLDRVGVNDDFFDLGGHSLAALRIVSQVLKQFQLEIPVRSLFAAPTIAAMAACIGEMQQNERAVKTPPLVSVSRDRHLPLSFAQQRLWFLDQLHPDSSVYSIPYALDLTGRLHVAALQQTLKDIVGRHESLRTAFVVVDGQPVHAIAPTLTFSVPVIDLQGFSRREQQAIVNRLKTEEARRPFDLTQAPLLRATLLRLGHEEHVLVLNMHHMVSDGWSIGILFRELSVLYEALSGGQPSPLSELSIQYADFALWQRQWLQGEVLEAQLSYWRKQLAELELLQLPTDRSRPAVQSYRGARQSIELSKELTGALKILSRKQSVTLFMTLLAAFQTLLHRYTGQHDIVVGAPIANRNRTEIEGLIGFFVNTLVLRSDLSGNPTFTELLARVREAALGAYTHQDIPFEKLVEEFQPERSLSHSPLFQVMFALQNAPYEQLELSGLTLEVMQIDNRTAKFDLLLSMSESAGGLKGSLEYSTDLFDAATIERMLGHFKTLLAGIVTSPDQCISNLPILTEVERQQLLRWNATEREFPKDQCVHELFEEQVKKNPDAVAVVFEDQQLSYRDLNRRANQLACYLKGLGVGPEKLVGICLERSVEMVIGLLGILKAGGAYVPLDPEYPRERLAFMLADSQATVLLTKQRLLESLPTNEARIVCLDKESESILRETEQNLASEVTGQNLAYAIYTSGSTGKPKAVAMTHRPLCNLLWWQLQNFTEPIPARTLQFSSLSFDVSFQEIFATWCSGGTLVLIPEELRRDVFGLVRCLQDQAVERLLLPFVALQQLAEAAQEEGVALTSLREIITAGEQLQITRPIVALFNKLKDCKLQNQYGPSESHVVTAFTLVGPTAAWPALPPIGQPIANSHIHILDPSLEPVPVGVVGELYVGGDCLARGYLNRPELTAETFIAHPFSSEPDARLYRTGDLARYKSDGNIEFLGRIDNQVKIRGFRIELGEIESVLDEHPMVRESAVLAREDDPGDKRLVAYVVPKAEVLRGRQELRGFLKGKLPEYMVPAVFVFLDSLPLTPSGKVDRNALRPPDKNQRDFSVPFITPRSPVETILARIWKDVLRLEKAGIHDNFFDLGGHSLLATQLVSRIRQSLQVEVPLRAAFEAPTIGEMALVIARNKPSASRQKDLGGMLGEVEGLSEQEAELVLAGENMERNKVNQHE